MSELGRLARGSAGTTLGGVVTALAAFCSVAIVARALGPAAAGVFGVCVAGGGGRVIVVSMPAR